MNGLKSATIDIGFTTNAGWRVYPESRDYVRTKVQTASGYVNNWLETINL